MRSASAFLLATLAGLAAIYFALTRTNNEALVGLLIGLFIFGGMPCLIFAIRGFFVALRRSPASPRTRFSALIHVCAAFGALVGAGVYALARASDNPAASQVAWLIIIFPAIIYGIKLSLDIVASLMQLIIRKLSIK
jgi:hypothetical protein